MLHKDRFIKTAIRKLLRRSGVKIHLRLSVTDVKTIVASRAATQDSQNFLTDALKGDKELLVPGRVTKGIVCLHLSRW